MDEPVRTFSASPWLVASPVGSHVVGPRRSMLKASKSIIATTVALRAGFRVLVLAACAADLMVVARESALQAGRQGE
ncbi:hypothetical protein [Vineibacter terrae]|uniref:hypothetical protein n=1 Tax=Vineibacter terrae TaxID=2586908 RepID=UPI002E33C42E|nr:hypothetical protein [Vineibacter terrae]HEX2890372.1 hypothetical protein [Vineibacter terrae]